MAWASTPSTPSSRSCSSCTRYHRVQRRRARGDHRRRRADRRRALRATGSTLPQAAHEHADHAVALQRARPARHRRSRTHPGPPRQRGLLLAIALLVLSALAFIVAAPSAGVPQRDHPLRAAATCSPFDSLMGSFGGAVARPAAAGHDHRRLGLRGLLSCVSGSAIERAGPASACSWPAANGRPRTDQRPGSGRARTWSGRRGRRGLRSLIPAARAGRAITACWPRRLPIRRRSIGPLSSFVDLGEISPDSSRGHARSRAPEATSTSTFASRRSSLGVIVGVGDSMAPAVAGTPWRDEHGAAGFGPPAGPLPVPDRVTTDAERLARASLATR